MKESLDTLIIVAHSTLVFVSGSDGGVIDGVDGSDNAE
jgi:hypothetical protein